MSVLKYQILNLKTNEIENREQEIYVVTQDGNIAAWDESQGWSTYGINQNDFEIILTEYIK